MYNIHEIKDTILQGDTLKQLRLLPDNSIDMVITSPPYWKLRDYGVKGQLGQEEDFRDYLKKLRYIFKEVYRVLKPTGSCYVNIGDTFAKKNVNDVKKKSLIGIPDRFKIDMIDMGFICRGEIVWHKPNQLPSSAKDRFNIDYEKMYFFTKTENYYFETQYEPMLSEIPKKINSNKTKNSKYKDTCMEKSVRQGLSSDRGNNLIEKRNLSTQEDFVKKLRKNFKISDIIEKTGLKKTLVEHWFRKDVGGFAYPKKEDWEKVVQAYDGFNPFPELLEVYYETDDVYKNADKGRIKRSVWSIPTKALKEEHYAPFPEELVETPIKACCPEGGIVLDIFIGSGTSGLVAKKLGKFYLGIELNPQFITLAYNRIYK